MPDLSQDEFEKHRPILLGLAYRMCGILADAEDIVQETHIKWSKADRSTVEDPRAWLLSVCSRLAMDLMKSARVRREQYVGTWLPEPFMASLEHNPDERAAIDDSVSVALMLAMERLTPSERATFILHDVFNYGFEEISSFIGKSEGACRKAASRARKAVREDRPRFTSTPAIHRQLLDAFIEAVSHGDAENLKSLLSESIELRSDGGGKVETAPDVLHGPQSVSEFFLKVWRESIHLSKDLSVVHQWFNGQPGVLLYRRSQRLVAITLSLENKRIRHVFAVRNPDKLARFSVI